MFITDEKNSYDVPVYMIRPDKEKEVRGTIILYHGWGSSVSRQHFRAQILASCGYRVLVPELINHGSRGSADYYAKASAGVFLETLEQSIKEFPLLAEQAGGGKPLFIAGHSLGGLIALGCVHGNAGKICAVAAMNSTINWNLNDTLMNDIYAQGGPQLAIDQKIIERLSDYDPSKWTEAEKTIPVLLTNGVLDKTIPAAYNQSFIQTYHPKNVKHVLFEDAGHVVCDHTLEEVANFFADNCKMQP